MQSRHNFEYMLAGLLFLLLVAPAIRQAAPQAALVLQPTAFGVALAASIWTLSTSKKWRVTGLVIGVALGAVGTLGAAYALPKAEIGAVIGFFAFCGWSIALTLRDVLMGPRVDLNRVMGAVCVYMLLGVFWGLAYLLVGVADPAAFNGVAGPNLGALSPEFFYFSFVTMTTLGYGDIAPAAPLARSLAYLQAVIGQLYVAILIAGMVGAHVASRMERRESHRDE